jgi:hypothetical protein
MKKFLITLLISCVLTFLFAGSASASLYAGTWNSATGTDRTQLGTWTEDFNGGTYPGFVNATPTMTSSGLPSGGISWSSTGSTCAGVHSDTGFMPYSGGGFSRTVSNDYTGGLFTFTFLDGNTYTTNPSIARTNTTSYFDSSYHYLYSTGSTWTITGVVNEDPAYTLITYATGHQTGFDAASRWGVNDYTRATLVPTVPIPGALWLFGSGLLGLIGIKRKIRS